MEQHITSPDSPTLATISLDEVAARLRGDPEALAEFVGRLGPEQERKDGWSPFARRLFLEVLAETGKVSTACEYTGLTRQAAYALRARDPLFAAGWSAACELARAPLADALYEKAVDGVTDTITKDGVVVATRHRFDSRLSVTVLSRLDKRCDRAEELGSKHLVVVRRWHEWIALVGKGDDEGARALLESDGSKDVPYCQTCQLPESANPIAEVSEDEGIDLSHRFWKDEDGVWMTDFPPPQGFTGYEKGKWEDGRYERECTPEEVDLLEADQVAINAKDRAEEERLRDAWFEMLKSELAPNRHPGLEPGSTFTSAPGEKGTQVPDQVRDDKSPEPTRPPAIVGEHETPSGELLQSGEESALTSPEDGPPVDK